MASFFYTDSGARWISNTFIRKDQVFEFDRDREQRTNAEAKEKDAVQRIEVWEIVEKNFGDGDAEHYNWNNTNVEAAPVNANPHQQHGIEKPCTGNAELLKVAEIFYDRWSGIAWFSAAENFLFENIKGFCSDENKDQRHQRYAHHIYRSGEPQIKFFFLHPPRLEEEAQWSKQQCQCSEIEEGNKSFHLYTLHHQSRHNTRQAR